MKDNIRIRWIGYGWAECETKWSKDRVQLSIAQLVPCLKEIIKLERKNKWEIHEVPKALVPQQTREKWQEREEQGEMSMHSRM